MTPAPECLDAFIKRKYHAGQVLNLYTHCKGSKDAMGAETLTRKWNSLISLNPVMAVAIFIVKDSSLHTSTRRVIREFMVDNWELIRFLSVHFDDTTSQRSFDNFDVPRLQLVGLELISFGATRTRRVAPTGLAQQPDLMFKLQNFGEDEEDSDDDLSEVSDMDTFTDYQQPAAGQHQPRRDICISPNHDHAYKNDEWNDDDYDEESDEEEIVFTQWWD